MKRYENSRLTISTDSCGNDSFSTWYTDYTMHRLLLVLTIVLSALIIPFVVLAAECDSNCNSTDECAAKISVCQSIWQDVQKAKAPHETSLRKMEKDIAAFQNRISEIGVEVEVKETAIKKSESELGSQQELLAKRVRAAYIRSYTNNPLLFFFSKSQDFGTILRSLAYQKAVTNEDKRVIIDIVTFIKSLEDKKATLEQEKITLADLKASLDVQASATRKLVTEATAYQNVLSSEISVLSAKQQAFLAEKLAGLNLPTSLGGGTLYCTDDRKTDPGFGSAFAFFTFGIPHRVGMNQYGALGRANAGQNHQDILRAYFDGINFENRGNVTIQVQGYGGMSLEDYLLGIYEMPSSWPIEAQKAQAVAARSYALAYTQNGANSICTTQSCQVYKGGNKGGDWERAVKETAGETMVRDGQVITAWYSSTDGGYTFASSDVGWSSRSWTKRTRDTNGDIASFGDLFSKAYDKDSPCFYAAQGWRKEYSSSAWLKQDEVADIVNVIMLAQKDSGTKSHLYQTDKPNPEGAETWDKERVKQELRSRGGSSYDNVSNVTASSVDFGVGKTNQVTIEGNAGSNSFSGTDFVNYFNLRAPANIQIVGGLFNIEKR
ncbi:MAG: Amidase enhancer [Candidatus Gottesmanbacteria bacterium GW2011_GWB1_43_11]|uniref:Amidase enhancer n=1 Tax=Candidatus Gottesmanbacteria bacterium GW2011_GWB1_43_11 TaxID=1618446 RepID=A0A0G1CLT1_9BACT|nr:MAG: Amidase enhancer [Candidatus Gottesmanbacteria bacterium GW2011_GWA2_42_16]KKS53523.1 MAG: Amidase enhancer [Candidatus Gottesmanbacteria bacterium GW2011_GWA1_42_26]KKS81198.1 MAG: Amidase enhancer [Candidatus Gottesmanbacteria bacterium GW2011_GWC1_43_10]KKS86457.1 MAG: Amidase enhancer [Candidatus Gottesmanbacteria bacterium GW2011_GWB1_43_11]HCM37439.1 hypothetical protein [Patescibacteria group bacterium]